MMNLTPEERRLFESVAGRVRPEEADPRLGFGRTRGEDEEQRAASWQKFLELEGSVKSGPTTWRRLFVDGVVSPRMENRPKAERKIRNHESRIWRRDVHLFISQR